MTERHRKEHEKEVAAASCFLGMMLGGLVSLSPLGIAAGGIVGYKTGQLVARFDLASGQCQKKPANNSNAPNRKYPPPHPPQP